MGKRDDSGSSNQAGSFNVAGEKKPRAKRKSSSAIQYARELSKNDNSKHMEIMHDKLMDSVLAGTPGVYHIFYSNGVEAVVTINKGKRIIRNPDNPGKKYKNFGLDGIVYISKATKSRFSDSLGFVTGIGNERTERIYAKERTFNAYNKEVRKLFKRKKKKSSTKKRSSNTNTGKKK